MARRINLSGLVIAGLGFFLTRFTVTLALYEEPVRFLLAGIVPLTLGLSLAAFGVALAVADVEAAVVRTVAVWAVVGAGTMLVLALLTLFGLSTGELPALATVRSRAYLSNFLIGGSVGGTLTGLYASRNRRQRTELKQQANRLEVLNRLLRHEVLNSLTVIRGYATEVSEKNSRSIEAIQQSAEAIEQTIDEVKHLARSARWQSASDSPVRLKSLVEASINDLRAAIPDADITLDFPRDDLTVKADDRLRLLFDRLFERAIARTTDGEASIDVTVNATMNTVRIAISTAGDHLSEREQALLETGEISRYDDPNSGFGLNLARLLVERYRGSIETAVAGGTTTITVVLPRADTGEGGLRPLPTELSGVRPAMPHLMVTLGAAMIAGVIWGIGSELFGGSVAGIGVFYGTVSPLVGWITHQFHSGVFGFVYAGMLSVLPENYRNHLPAYVTVGIVWGLVLWVAAAGIIAPIWLRLLGIPASIPNLTVSLFVAHLSWGVSLGLLTVWGYRSVVPWLERLHWPSIRLPATN